MKIIITNRHGLKDQAKANVCNKFIGLGSPASSTNRYKLNYGQLANCGEYLPDDWVFISAEGNRGGRIPAYLAEVKLAVKAGATLVTDNNYNRNRSYNRGEREVYQYLINYSNHVEEDTGQYATWAKP